MRRIEVLRRGGFVGLLAAGVLAGCEPGHEDACAGNPGTLCTIAGTTEYGFGGDGGHALEATFYRPTDVAVVPGTNEYVVVDFNNHKIRWVHEDGTIETIIGTAGPGDGAPDQSDRVEPGAPGLEVGLNHPVQVEWGPDGLLYLPNWHNHKVRVYDPETGLVRVIVANTDPLQDGNGANAGYANPNTSCTEGDGCPAEEALLFFPNSLVFGEDGEFYILDQKNERVRVVDAGMMIDTVAGKGEFGFEGDGGPAEEATFRFVDDPSSLQPEQAGAVEFYRAPDGRRLLFIADTYNHCIRQVDLDTGIITALAGNGTMGMDGDGGPATEALLNKPKDIEIGPDGRLYIADTDNHLVRAVDLETGIMETVAGTGEAGISEDGLPATESKLNRPFGLDFDADGNLLIADYDNNRIARVIR